jgi:uncharacterized membrane protein
MSLFRLRHELRSMLWVIPLLCLIGSLVLAIATLAVDRANDYTLISRSVVGSATSVAQILSSAGTSLLTLATIVVTLTLVAVQVAMGQFSPRIVRAILEDRRNQLALGLIIGTFVYTMAVLRDVETQPARVPGLSVLVSYGLILASVAMLVLFINRTAQALRVSGLIDLVGDSTLAELRRLRPAEHRQQRDPRTIVSPKSGNVSGVNYEGLVDIASKANRRLELLAAMGEFVPGGGTLFRVHGGELERPERVLAHVVLEPERSHYDDPSYGIRKLVDIALRSIASSPLEDPTTSVQALHRVHDCLRLLATRELPSGRYHDTGGDLRLVVPVLTWEGYVRLAFDEIRIAGAGSPQIARALRAKLYDLKSIVAAERQQPLEQQLELLDAAITRKYEEDADATAARVPDRTGLGSGPDLLAADGSPAATVG